MNLKALSDIFHSVIKGSANVFVVDNNRQHHVTSFIFIVSSQPTVHSFYFISYIYIFHLHEKEEEKKIEKRKFIAQYQLTALNRLHRI